MRMIYTRQTAEIDGHCSKPIVLKWGVRQGCALSSLLFYLVIETLAKAVHQCEKIQGILTSTIIHQIALYAGFFLQDPEYFLPALDDKILNDFAGDSSYWVNRTKSTMMGINIANDVKERILRSSHVIWCKRTKYLGINMLNKEDPQGMVR